MNNLKPCPFCGGQADISVDHEAVKDTEGRRWAYTIVCNRCCATSGLTYSPKKARDAWNRRAADGPAQTEPDCHCGQERRVDHLALEAETTQIIDGCCTACGALMDCCEAADYKFCPYCGKRVV